MVDYLFHYDEQCDERWRIRKCMMMMMMGIKFGVFNDDEKLLETLHRFIRMMIMINLLIVGIINKSYHSIFSIRMN